MFGRPRNILAAVASAGVALAGGAVAIAPDSVEASRAPQAPVLAAPATVVDRGLARGQRPLLIRPLPARWAVSATLALGPGSVIRVSFGGSGRPLELRASRRQTRRLEATREALAVDGRNLRMGRRAGRQLTIRVVRGSARVGTVLVTSADRADHLLLHRVAALHAHAAPDRFPIASDATGRIRSGRGWTSGFWPSALWQAARVARDGEPFARWALDVTLRHFGDELRDTHDLGFMYGRSSLEAYRRLCPDRTNAGTCAALRESALTAARTLHALAATNAAAGTLPMTAKTANADTIIDSVMNLALLTWATRETGDPAYAGLAARHAHAIEPLLVRANGATIQSVHHRRSDGAVLLRHTHQGAGDRSVWARGQAWAVYGFAQIGRELRDPALVQVSERAARYVAARLPRAGVPRYDYAAGPRAPIDVSSGVITAAGLYQLDRACRTLPGACERPARWAPLASRMLDASLAHASRRPPLGRLGSQVYKLGGAKRWMDDAELVFGIDYALEALAARATRDRRTA
jgi:unsaturated chondroitin disaccharide hydrolase